MELIFLGSASAFHVEEDNFHSNMLISINNKKLLIDCGTDARYALHKLKINPATIDAVYISHMHQDHIGGLEWFGFSRKFSELKTPHLFISEQLIEPLWDRALSGIMSCLDDEAATLSSFFVPHPIGDELMFTWETIDFRLIPVHHIIDNGVARPCFGLLFEVGGQTIFLTTDTRYTPEQLMPYYEQADIIFHDCETDPKSGTHAHFEQLCQLPKEIRSKTWLYHCNSQYSIDAHAYDFLGVVTRGQRFNF